MLLHSTVCEVLYVLSWTAIDVSALPDLRDSNSQNLLCAISWATYRSEEFDLIHCRLRVVLCTLHHLHCNKPLHPATTEQVTFANRKHRTRSYHNSVTVSCNWICFQLQASKNKNSAVRICSKVFLVLDVPGEPHGGEVSPAQFPDYMVFSVVKVSYFHVVVAT